MAMLQNRFIIRFAARSWEIIIFCILWENHANCSKSYESSDLHKNSDVLSRTKLLLCFFNTFVNIVI
jgi:hypothetical protein